MDNVEGSCGASQVPIIQLRSWLLANCFPPLSRMRPATMLRFCKFLIVIALLPLMAAAPAQAHGADQKHPLDGLDSDEISLAVELLRARGHATDRTLFHYVGLVDPPKSRVLAALSHVPTQRQAVAIVRKDAKTFEAMIDLTGRKVDSWGEIDGVQPNILNTEWALANRLVRGDQRWRSAMERRGIRDFDQVYCATLTVGNFDNAETRRLVRMPCYDISAGGPNIYARPIEGVEATVDLDREAVASVYEGPIIAGSKSDLGLGRSVADAGSLVTRDQVEVLPEMNASMVEWGNWSFHLRNDFRFGPILSLIQFGHKGERRSVLYQASLSELVVPYMSEDRSWFYRTYMDVGEYGFGAASRLIPGQDCPNGARMISSTFANDAGQPYSIANNACLFVRSSEQPLWRHSEIYNSSRSIEPGRELVLRTIPTVGNYDYIIDWVFAATGEIRIEVGATGILAVRGIDRSAHFSDDAARIAPDLEAVNHDHFFSFRLDFDIESKNNRVQIDRIVPAEDSDLSPRRIWKTDSTPVTVEGALLAGPDVLGWRVTNNGVLNSLGQHPGYQVLKGPSATSIYSDGDWSLARSRFSTAPIWITRFNPGEQFAAGRFPNQSTPDRGLPEYLNGESVSDADVVLWPTLGMRHVPRPEEWPIMPTMTRSIVIRPFGFQSSNPALSSVE
ncbi:hypothetical protein P7228_04240 [Altererythrobacter arenosus]|uniref:Amine oxidase n=1 Tax=Altererythrobacter arenosus TaxID=3032592 RepID=A0ABY8FTD9_9SPHN|nr:hypothetical protein [Altererythrobacter sp. CAU 1644]WFL78281.1 hypothetical protein P7228_04240 [Altererythrobacter sp. CAU 1644]